MWQRLSWVGRAKSLVKTWALLVSKSAKLPQLVWVQKQLELDNTLTMKDSPRRLSYSIDSRPLVDEKDQIPTADLPARYVKKDIHNI